MGNAKLGNRKIRQRKVTYYACSFPLPPFQLPFYLCLFYREWLRQVTLGDSNPNTESLFSPLLQKKQPLVRRRNIQTSRLITFSSQLSHWVQSMRRVAFSFLSSVASLLISRATTEKSAFYFSDSRFWFNGTMPSYCMTVLRRMRRSKVHSSLIFVLFCTA